MNDGSRNSTNPQHLTTTTLAYEACNVELHPNGLEHYSIKPAKFLLLHILLHNIICTIM